MFTARVIAGKAVYVLSCLTAAVLLVVSGYAHKAVGQITGLEKGIAISGAVSAGASAGSSVGAMNILLMGLESRTNFQGQTLSSQLLTAMHAGSVNGVNNLGVGSQDTDTLILIHIFAGGQKAVGFSIPRDDLVTYPGQYFPGVTEGKIDGAYYFAYANFLNQNPSMSSSERYTKANQAGEAAEIATVESVTGQHIDHFVETNLVGFFSLAQAFGGIEVCVKPWAGSASLAKDANLSDKASGWAAVADGYSLKKGGDQYLHLAADQALAFVRDRDSLPELDFDRTRRQQAVLDYVIWKLKHEGAFSDLAMISGLLGTASQYVITDAYLNLLDFATDMRALTGKNLSFQTLPGTPENDVPLNGSSQDVVVINVSQIKEIVRNTFYPPAAVPKTATPTATKTAAPASTPTPAASTVTVDVYNGGTTQGLATSVSQALVALGYKAGAVADASTQSKAVETGTQVFYGAGASANASTIATPFGTTALADASLAAGHVEVLLGSASAAVPAGLATPASATPTGTATAPASTAPASAATASGATPAATSAAGTDDGTGGGSVTVTANAPYGIPCVY